MLSLVLGVLVMVVLVLVLLVVGVVLQKVIFPPKISTVSGRPAVG